MPTQAGTYVTKPQSSAYGSVAPCRDVSWVPVCAGMTLREGSARAGWKRPEIGVAKGS